MARRFVARPVNGQPTIHGWRKKLANRYATLFSLFLHAKFTQSHRLDFADKPSTQSEDRGDTMTLKLRFRSIVLLAAVLGTPAALLSLVLAPIDIASAGQGEAKIGGKSPLILIIRHGEKTGDKADVHLSKQGKERAEVLYQLFETSAKRAKSFPRPDFIFAARNSKSSQRPVETVTVLAKKLGVPINEEYQSKSETTDKKAMSDLARELRGQAKYAGKTVLVSWRHGVLPELAREFLVGAPNRDKVEPAIPKKWGDNVYDRVWEIRYDGQGNVSFVDRPQALMPGDSAK